MIKPRKEPYNFNKNNPDKILRIIQFGATPNFTGSDIFVEGNLKKMTHPKYWATVRVEFSEGFYPIFLRVDYARKVN